MVVQKARPMISDPAFHREILRYIKKHPKSSDENIAAGLGYDRAGVSMALMAIMKDNNNLGILREHSSYEEPTSKGSKSYIVVYEINRERVDELRKLLKGL